MSHAMVKCLFSFVATLAITNSVWGQPAEKPTDKPAAEPLPANIRDYFDRAATAREFMEKKYARELEVLDIEIRGEGVASKKSELKSRRIRTQRLLDELKKSKVSAFIPVHADNDAIGFLPPIYIEAVLDDKTAIASHGHHSNQLRLRDRQPEVFIITNFDTKDLKKDRQIELDADLWTAAGHEYDSEAAKRYVKNRSFTVVEPVKKSQVEKFRPQYEQEKKEAAKILGQ